MKIPRYILSLALVLFIFRASEIIPRGNTKYFCSFYFTQIGCIHCALSDPYLFTEILPGNPHVVMLEYEIARSPGNGRVFAYYARKFNGGFSVPHIVSGDASVIVGDSPILERYEGVFTGRVSSCPLPGKNISVEKLPFSQLPGNPVVWRGKRVMFRRNEGGSDSILQSLLISNNIRQSLNEFTYKRVKPAGMAYSGGEVIFKNAVLVEGWVLQWNDI